MNRRPSWNRARIDEKLLVDLYINGASGTEMAKQFNVSWPTIYNRLRFLSVRIKTNSESHVGKAVGENNPNWKGGKCFDTAGYVRVSVCGRQVREHRIVASKMIGRPLLPGEVIHHINGNRKDNRPENLEVLPSQSAHMREHMTSERARAMARRLAALKAVGYQEDKPSKTRG